MEVKRNYQRELEQLLQRLSASSEMEIPKLLLHACCAPCSSYVLEYLSSYFSIYLLYYNPNISPVEEYEKRKLELERLVSELPVKHKITLVSWEYDGHAFTEIAKDLENEPEGGARCARCYRLRLEEAAKMAKRLQCDYFTTTLSISPLKRSDVLNAIGEEVGRIYQVSHLPSDFKKKEGYKRSIQLSHKYGLYRQDYCGCVYSYNQSLERKTQKGDDL